MIIRLLISFAFVLVRLVFNRIALSEVNLRTAIHCKTIWPTANRTSDESDGSVWLDLFGLLYESGRMASC